MKSQCGTLTRLEKMSHITLTHFHFHPDENDEQIVPDYPDVFDQKQTSVFLSDRRSPDKMNVHIGPELSGHELRLNFNLRIGRFDQLKNRQSWIRGQSIMDQ